MWYYSCRLWTAHQTARMELNDAVKSKEAILAISLHALQKVFALAGRYSVAFLAERMDKLLTGGQIALIHCNISYR